MHKKELKEGMDENKLYVDPIAEIWQSGARTGYTGGDLDRCPELQVGVVDTFELKILAEEWVFQGSLL